MLYSYYVYGYSCRNCEAVTLKTRGVGGRIRILSFLLPRSKSATNTAAEKHRPIIQQGHDARKMPLSVLFAKDRESLSNWIRSGSMTLSKGHESIKNRLRFRSLSFRRHGDMDTRIRQDGVFRREICCVGEDLNIDEVALICEAACSLKEIVFAFCDCHALVFVFAS